MKAEKRWKIIRIVFDLIFYILIILALIYLSRFLATYKQDPCSLCQNITGKTCFGFKVVPG